MHLGYSSHFVFIVGFIWPSETEYSRVLLFIPLFFVWTFLTLFNSSVLRLGRRALALKTKDVWLMLINGRYLRTLLKLIHKVSFYQLLGLFIYFILFKLIQRSQQLFHLLSTKNGRLRLLILVLGKIVL